MKTGVLHEMHRLSARLYVNALLLACLSWGLLVPQGCNFGRVGNTLSGLPTQSEPPVKSVDQPAVDADHPPKDRLAKALEEALPTNDLGFE